MAGSGRRLTAVISRSDAPRAAEWSASGAGTVSVPCPARRAAVRVPRRTRPPGRRHVGETGTGGGRPGRRIVAVRGGTVRRVPPPRRPAYPRSRRPSADRRGFCGVRLAGLRAAFVPARREVRAFDIVVSGEVPPDPEKALLEGAVGGQLAGRDDPADPAVDHDRDVLGDGRRDPDVLFDEEDGDVALGREGREQLLELGDDEGGEPLGRLVEHQQPRVLEEGARDGEHLLLAARELAAAVAPPLGEPREHVVHPIHGPRAAAAPREAQVLVHGEVRPEPAPLGGVGDAPRRDLVGGEPGDVVPLEADRAPPHREEPHDRVAQGRLAHAVPPDHRVDPLVQGEVDALQGMGLVVVDMQVADLEGRRRGGPAARPLGPPVGPTVVPRAGPLSHGRAPGRAPGPPGRSRSRPGSLP